jgi:hypothetical protein
MGLRTADPSETSFGFLVRTIATRSSFRNNGAKHVAGSVHRKETQEQLAQPSQVDLVGLPVYPSSQRPEGDNDAMFAAEGEKAVHFERSSL